MPPREGSLSSIVASLVRAQVGASSSAVADDALDRHVADLLLQEAKQKDKQWGDRGTRAYYDPEKERNAPIRKPNTRFLTSIIRNVDDHNASLRRADEAAARQREQEERAAADRWRREQRGARGDRDRDGRRLDDDDEESRRLARRRREELGLAHDARDERRHSGSAESSGGSRRNELPRADRHSDERDEQRSRRRKDEDRRSRSPRTRDRRERGDTRSPHSTHRYRSSSQDRIDDEDKRRHRSSRSSDRPRRHRDDDDHERRHRSRDSERGSAASSVREKSKGKERELDEVFADLEDEVARDGSTRAAKRIRRSPSAPLPASPPPPPPTAPVPSKMDKYFSPSYDPALDFTLDDVTDRSTGLVGPGGFDGWDRMLATVQARKEDQRAREAREKAERKAERERVRREREEKRRRRRGEAPRSDSEDEVGPKVDPQSGLLEMQYSRAGKTREWDKGKETPT
ncbi:hypothetical protein JCM3770_000654 [Rhodotorula araucariae]